MQESLGISFRLGHSPQFSPKKLSNPEWSKLTSVISAYRLLDIVAMVNGADQAPRVERQSLLLDPATFRVSDKICLECFLI